MAEIDNLDIPGRADLFARTRMGGRRSLSAVINGHDSFSFRKPNAPFTWLLPVSRGATFATPITSLRVRIRTANVRFAGTDDDVYLRISGTRRFKLDKRLYDDFERGDDDVYSVPVDGALADGLSVGNIRYLQIEKSRDGVAGGWRLGGVTVWINERLAFRDNAVNRWLEDGHRTFRARRFTRPPERGAGLPVFFQLWEMDAPLRGGHDHTDTHPWASRRDTTLVYVPGSGVRAGRTAGGRRFGGRLGDGDRARLSWRLSTADPVLPAITPAPEPTADPTPDPAPDPTPPAPPPDLRITSFDLTQFTVTNSGNGPAGPFLVSAQFLGSFAFPGLAAGQSISRPAIQACSDGGVYSATVDSAGQVAESDETNNSFQFGPVIC